MWLFNRETRPPFLDIHVVGGHCDWKTLTENHTIVPVSKKPKGKSKNLRVYQCKSEVSASKKCPFKMMLGLILIFEYR